VFDPGQVAREHRGPDSERLTIAQMTGTARPHARWSALAADQKAGVAELREVAGDRSDLLVEVAGIATGTAEGKGEEYLEQGRAVAELCRCRREPDTGMDRGGTAPGRGRAASSVQPA
jgi:hypothetical protein